MPSPELADLRHAIDLAQERQDAADALLREQQAREAAEESLRRAKGSADRGNESLSAMLGSLAAALSDVVFQPVPWAEHDVAATAAAKESLDRRRQQLEHLQRRLSPSARATGEEHGAEVTAATVVAGVEAAAAAWKCWSSECARAATAALQQASAAELRTRRSEERADRVEPLGC